jgi:hypothetical protein
VTRRDGQPDRATLRRQRSETFWAAHRDAARTPEQRAAVEFDRLRVRARRAVDPAAAWVFVAAEIRKIGDRL